MDKAKSDNGSLQVQEVLSLGYIYLLVLGVIHNAIYFNLIGINYLEHSSVLDVLISPISVITSNLKSIIAFVGIIIISIVYIKVIIPFLVKWRRKQKKYQEGKNLEKINKLETFSKSNYSFLFIIALFIFAYFIGFGYGLGMKNKQRIEQDTITNNYTIEFINGKTIEAKILGKNSLNVFYVVKGDKSVSVSPVDGNIMKIQKLAKESKQ